MQNYMRKEVITRIILVAHRYYYGLQVFPNLIALQRHFTMKICHASFVGAASSREKRSQQDAAPTTRKCESVAVEIVKL